MTDAPLLSSVLPRLATRIEASLRAQGETRLADQVSGVRVTEVCRCDLPFCASFHTLKHPFKRYFIRGRQLEVRDDEPGEITVDVVRGEIAYVEVLNLEGARETLFGLPAR